MLESLLGQRQALLDSDQTPLTLLRPLDRRIVLWCEQHPECLADPAWTQASEAPHLALLWLEVAALVQPQSPVERLPELEGLIGSEATAKAHWQLAASHAEVVPPATFPEASAAQPWAAMALLRRGLQADCPAPWQKWAEALNNPETFGPSVREWLANLWARAPEDWALWFYPLLVAMPREARPDMVNWLAGRVADDRVIEAMGISGCGQFKPWLSELAGQEPHAEIARAELDWLEGQPGATTMLYGRWRTWWSRWQKVDGAPHSLFGGRW
ncbi:hypothetical protein QQM79_03470 [Marinobacteraceae bacterium S3BR75-40.1]